MGRQELTKGIELMASVHRRDRSPYWWAQWRDSTGRLYYRSTKQTAKHKALAFALECERAEKHATAGTLTESQARDIVASIMERTQTGDTLRNPKTREWLTEWLEGKEASKAETTGIRYRQTIEDFLDYLGDRANRPLVAITARDIQGFVDLRARQGVGPSTINVDGKTLRSAFTRARKQGLISSNPAEAVDLPARRSIERGTFTPAEVKMLVDAAEGEWKTLILIGYYTAARLSECCRVEWKDINLSKGTISFPDTKQGKPHTLPLRDELTKHLERIAGDTPGPLMPHLASVRVSGRRGLSQHFLGVMAKAGLDAEAVDAIGGKRQLHKRTFHSLRHSFTSALANAGVSPELRMKLTGHRSEAVHAGYTHHELQTLRDALAKLPSIG
jgi:integrase